MSHILLITSSPRAASYSTKVAHSLAQQLVSLEPNASITVRDLAHDPLPHIDDSFAAARDVPPENLTPAQKETLALSDELLQELFAADSIVIAAGMINLGIPSTLKAYIDHIARPRVTFRYSEKGPEGLVKGKKVYLVVARGGVYSQGPMQAFNFQDTYLRTVLSFIGLNDIELITVEGVGYGPEAAGRAVGKAMAEVSAIGQTTAIAA
jgi:FMN-dependent NADH-azoreductase